MLDQDGGALPKPSMVRIGVRPVLPFVIGASVAPRYRGGVSGSTLYLGQAGCQKGARKMFTLDVSGWSILLRTAIVYLALLFGLRLAGKRGLGQMTPFDLVVILLIANAVQNAMVGPDTSVAGGLIAAGVLITINYAVANARERLPWLRGAVEGSPTLLISDGAFVAENLRREGIDSQEVMMAIREHGVADISDVRLAILETDGTVSIVPKEAPTLRTRRRVKAVRRGA